MSTVSPRRRRGPRVALRLAALTVCILLVTHPAVRPAAAYGQETTPTASADAPPERAVIVVDSASHLVGGAIRVLDGAAGDPLGQEGAAAVLGLALERVLSGALAHTATSATVTVDRAAFTVTFLADPQEWAASLAIILDGVFAAPPLVVLEQARADYLQRLRFEVGAPVRDFHEQRFAVLFGATSEWARTARGTVDSLLRVDLEALGRRLVEAPGRATTSAALIGPIDRDEAVRLMAPFGAGDAAAVAALETTDEPGAPSTSAWGDGFLQRIPAEITSTWVSVAFPAPSDTPRDHLAFLAHHVREYLSPIPVRPGLVDPRVELLEAPGGPVMLITFAAAPEAAARWTQRVTEVVRLERDAPPDDRFFAWERRRFRSAWRRSRAGPDASALALALERWTLLATGPAATVERLGIADLEAVAARLGPARAVLYGPDLGQSGTGR